MLRYRGWVIWCVALFCLLAGCSEAVVPASVVIDGKVTIPDGGYLTGDNGFTVNAQQVVAALGGSIKEISPTGIVITLNGRRILVSYGAENASYDEYIKASPSAVDGVLQLTGGALEKLMPAAFPKGKAYRQKDKIYVNSGN